jgi:hypothetical protein
MQDALERGGRLRSILYAMLKTMGPVRYDAAALSNFEIDESSSVTLRKVLQ